MYLNVISHRAIRSEPLVDRQSQDSGRQTDLSARICHVQMDTSNQVLLARALITLNSKRPEVGEFAQYSFDTENLLDLYEFTKERLGHNDNGSTANITENQTHDLLIDDPRHQYSGADILRN